MTDIRVPILVESDDLARYFAAKNVTTACPFCATNGWTVHDTDKYNGVGLGVMGPDGRIPPAANFMPAIVLTCNNCFYMWLIARFPVEDWIKENPSGSR